MDETIPLLILADDQLTRAGLAAVLADVAGIEVAGMDDTSSDIGDLVEIHRPHLILWDLGWDPLPESNGDFSALERLAAATDLDLPILALVPDAQTAAVVWRAGVAALLPRSVVTAQLAAAVPAVARGLHVFAPLFATEIVAPQPTVDFALVETLTGREEEVLALLAEGMTNRAIGRALSISEHTAKFHIQSLMGNLGAQSRTEVVVRATRLGLLTL